MNNLFVDEMVFDHVQTIIDMTKEMKYFIKAKKALKKSPIQYKVWTSAWHNDLTYGGAKFEVYDNRGRTIASIQITCEPAVTTEFRVTTNKFRDYKSWITYLKKSIKEYYK